MAAVVMPSLPPGIASSGVSDPLSTMSSHRIKCSICDRMILPATAEANGGLCAQCVKIPPARREIAAAVHAEADPLGRAIEQYDSLIDSLAAACAGRDLGAMADPEFTGVRFYAPETVRTLPAYDEATEVGAEQVDEIEHYLLAAAPGYSLLRPIATKLREISPSFNAAGRTVFVASMGMRREEIAWLIRYVNDRPAFDRFLRDAGLTEAAVDVYNEAYGQELHAACH